MSDTAAPPIELDGDEVPRREFELDETGFKEVPKYQPP